MTQQSKLYLIHIYSQHPLTQKTLEQISDYIMLFKLDEFSTIVPKFSSKLYEKLKQDNIPLNTRLFKNFVNLAVTYQQWELLKDLLIYVDLEILSGDIRTQQYIKENLIYLMDTTLRADIRKLIDRA